LASIPPKAREALELARRGEIARAILSGEAAVREAPDDGPLRLFMGFLHARRMDLGQAVPHLRKATALIPGDPLPRIELARALVATGDLAAAETVIAGTGREGRHEIELLRVESLLRQRRGAHGEAAALCARIVRSDPADFESWGRAGVSLLALGDAPAAVAALRRALGLRPDQPQVRAKLAEAQVAAGLTEEGLEEARTAVRAFPHDPLVRVTLARLEELLGRPEAAEATLGEALALDPDCIPALLALAGLQELDNRLDSLERSLAHAQAAGAPAAQTALPRARLLYRRGQLDAALDLARSAPEAVDAGGRARLIGEISDRLGDCGAAFAAFAEMNRLTALEVADPAAAACAFRDGIAGLARLTTRAWHESWTPAAPAPERPAPAFLFGFPRSGTTLLDTFLLGHPDICMIEERPVLQAVADRLGPMDRLANLSAADILALRAVYFAELDRIEPAAKGRRVIDKLPLGILSTPLVHRLFPEARILFVERHPCDVVLSGFMTRFDPRGGMANFLDLDSLARLYDGVMDYWRRCRDSFPLAVHEIRYERLIEDPRAELAPLAAFLGLGWDPNLLDHRSAARARRYIATPSYSQVAEPLYTRARGRWRRYRDALEPILPLLRPWAERMGYEV
jgi:tetratricopeptide (TPR) repeat protein